MTNDTSSSAGDSRLAAGEHDSIVGRGIREGNRLFRAWFDELTAAPRLDQKVAYVFVMGSLAELMRAFDFNFVLPEINSLQTAVRHVSESYIAQAEDYGYSSDVCGYVKADVGLQLRGGEHPMGQIPRPNIAVFTGACNTYIKWAEIWDRMFHIPTFNLDVPGPRAAGQLPGRGHVDFENDLRYVAGQIDELISVCEDLTGKRLDVGKLQEAMSYANTMTRHWRKVLDLNTSRPALYNSVTDGTVYLGVVNGFRGRPEGARYFEQVVEELEYKAANGIGTLHEEKHRLALVGVPCYPIYRHFNEMFSERGGVFVGSTYTWFASGGWSTGFEYDLEHPLESLAEGVLVTVRDSMNSMFHTDRLLAEMAGPYGIDGIVYHAIKSCRTVSAGMADSRRAVMEQADVGTLLIDSDHMDPRVVSEAQMKNRVDAFFEGLETRKLHATSTRGAA